MRLYAKLIAVVLLAAAAQWGMHSGGEATYECWYAARCLIAHRTGSERMQDELMREYADRRFGTADAVEALANAGAGGGN